MKLRELEKKLEGVAQGGLGDLLLGDDMQKPVIRKVFKNHNINEYFDALLMSPAVIQ